MGDISRLVIDNTPIVRSPVWRIGPDGKPKCYEPGEEDTDYQGRKVVPPQGSYTLRVAGIAEPQNEPNKFDTDPQRPKPYVDKTWIEFEIVQGRNLTGRWFSNKWTWSLNEQSTMGKFVKKMLAGSVPTGKWTTADLLGREFEAIVTPKSESYAELLVDTVLPAETEPDDLSTAEQRRAIWEAAKAIWIGQTPSKAKLQSFLDHVYEVQTTKELSAEQAAEALRFLTSEPHDSIKQLVDDHEATQSDEYDDIPE